MANRSLNQFRRELETFAATHAQLQTVQFNKQRDLLDGGDIRYWAFYYTLNKVRKEDNQLAYNFTAWVADAMNKEKDNESEIWSDAVLIATDLLAFIDDVDHDYALEDGIDLRNFTEATGDMLAGVEFEFTVRMPFAFDRCLIPIKSDETGFLMTEDGRYITTENGRKIKIDTATGTLVYAETGEPLVTEDGQNLILE